MTSLKEENQQLKDQLEKISSKYVNLEVTHKELECSYENLVESHTLIDVTNEVMVNSLKFHEPLSHTCTRAQVKFDSSCANPCVSKDKLSWFDQVLVESCDDLIAHENDNLKQEVEKLKMDLSRLKGKSFAQPSQDNHDDMVKKIEKGSILQSSCNNSTKIITRQKQDNKKRKLDHIKCFKCSHMGHYASMCSFKEHDKSNQSKRQRSLVQRRCFGCHEKGHKIEACVN